MKNIKIRIIIICIYLIVGCKNNYVNNSENQMESKSFEIREVYVKKHILEFDSLLSYVDRKYSDSLFRYTDFNGVEDSTIQWQFNQCLNTSNRVSTCDTVVSQILQSLNIKECFYVSQSGRKSFSAQINIIDTLGSDDYRFTLYNFFEDIPKNMDGKIKDSWYLYYVDSGMF